MSTPRCSDGPTIDDGRDTACSMWLSATSINGSNAVAPVDAHAPETAASLEDMYRETSPAHKIITCGARDHQDAWAARRANRARGSPGSAHGFGSGARGRAGLILHALGLPRPPGIVRGACEGGVIRMTLQGGQASQSQGSGSFPGRPTP